MAVTMVMKPHKLRYNPYNYCEIYQLSSLELHFQVGYNGGYNGITYA